MDAKENRLEQLATEVVDAAFQVHRTFGPGLLETVYEKALLLELTERGYVVEAQKEIPVTYRNTRLECGFRADLIVEGSLLVELKAVDALAPVHRAQVLTYLKLTRLTLGLLINFNVPLLQQGLQRVVLHHPSDFPSRPSRLRG